MGSSKVPVRCLADEPHGEEGGGHHQEEAHGPDEAGHHGVGQVHPVEQGGAAGDLPGPGGEEAEAVQGAGEDLRREKATTTSTTRPPGW